MKRKPVKTRLSEPVMEIVEAVSECRGDSIAATLRKVITAGAPALAKDMMLHGYHLNDAVARIKNGEK